MKCPVITRDHEIIHGDSADVLDCIAPGSVGLVFTSPPYYNARDYSQWKTYDGYLNDMRVILHKAKSTLKDGHYMIVDVSPVIVKYPGEARKETGQLGRRIPLQFHFAKIMEDEGLDFIDDIIWEKPVEATDSKRGLNFYMHKNPLIYYPYPTNEHLLVYRNSIGRKAMTSVTSKVPKRIRDESKVTEEVERGETWHIPPAHNKDHPATFPDELASRVIKLYSYKEDTILDPFVGSGTTCRVAKGLGRRCIGIEKNAAYHEIALRSIGKGIG
jgi:DNA modification methylase